MKHNIPDPDAFIRQQAVRPDFEPYQLADLQFQTFPPLREIVEGFIYEGSCIFAARPKMRKTFLLSQVGLAVADGTVCLGGRATTRSEVLFLALEDSERSMQWRMTKILGAWRQDWPAGFHVVHKWPRGKECIGLMRSWLNAHRAVGLVVVDVLARILPERDSKQRDSYSQDYDAVVQLTDLARETGVALVIIHHLRKSESGEDPLDTISGTLGLVGAADGAFAMQKVSQGTQLYGRHRFAADIEQAMEFDEQTFQWSFLGPWGEVQRSEERKSILDLLRRAGEPMAPRDIAKTLDRSESTIRGLLMRMMEAGELMKPKTGMYTIRL